MIYRSEPMEDCFRQVDELVHRYYKADPAIAAGAPKLDIQWEHYLRLDANDMMFVMTCRQLDEALVGCALYVIGPHPHYNGKTFAYCAILAVDKAYRGQGVGRALVAGSMIKLRERGVQFITHGSRMVYDVEPLFAKLGFTLYEQTFIKELV
jgi:GNAT superfamily N-acetyltransferase